MSFLSPQQEYLLKVLREIGCLRKKQATALLHRQFDVSPEAVSHILRQLKMLGQMREYGGVLSTVGESVNIRMLRAVDLAFAIFPGEALQLTSAANPFILSAYSEQQDMVLLILYVPLGKEERRCMAADNPPPSEVRTMVILLLDEEGQKSYIHTRTPCLVAYPIGSDGLKIEKQREG